MHATKNPVKISKIYAIDLLGCFTGTIQSILKANNLDQPYFSPYINLKHKRIQRWTIYFYKDQLSSLLAENSDPTRNKCEFKKDLIGYG